MGERSYFPADFDVRLQAPVLQVVEIATGSACGIYGLGRFFRCCRNRDLAVVPMSMMA